MAQSIAGIVFSIGVLVASIGFILLFSVDYTPPPIPAGYVIGLAVLTLGSGMIVGSVIMIIGRRKRKIKVVEYTFYAVIGVALVGLSLYLLFTEPLELPACPCAANFYGPDCEPCPKNEAGTCNDRGLCDDGRDGSGQCFCDLGWGGENCEVCAFNFEPEKIGNITSKCEKCTRFFDGDRCEKCYPGYTGANCDRCAEGWITEYDSLYGNNTLLCRTCKPGYWGGYCEPCKDCNTADPLAVCKDNVWHEENIYQFTKDSCTYEGQLCEDKYDCGSFNCKGICVIGDESTGELCEYDGDCGFAGTCQYKQCCLEQRHGSGHCDCNSVGYFGRYCEACPGFDGFYSSTICTGHGTCVELLAEDEYVGLGCECNQQGTTPFPAWSGETCSCLKDFAGQNNCSECATGSYGEFCQSCPGGSGISQCNMHGKCSDGINGDGTCDCHLDIKYNGLGGFKGPSCSECASDDFYGENCRTCPNIRKEKPPEGGVCPANKFTFADGDCTNSCTVQKPTCNQGLCQ